MEFITERLMIRPFKSEDLPEVFHLYRNEKTCKYLLHGPWTHENKESLFEKKRKNHTLTKNTSLSLAVVRGTNVIGDLSVWYTEMRETVEIGYSFADEMGR